MDGPLKLISLVHSFTVQDSSAVVTAEIPPSKGIQINWVRNHSVKIRTHCRVTVKNCSGVQTRLEK